MAIVYLKSSRTVGTSLLCGEARMKLERITEEEVRREVLIENALISDVVIDLVNLTVRKFNLAMDLLEQEIKK